MNKLGTIAWLFLIATLSACFAVEEFDYIPCEEEDYMRSSVFSLIANPEKYNNLHVIVEGYFFASDRSSKLYPNKVSVENYVFENGISLELNRDQVKTLEALNGTWKHLHGKFIAEKNRHGFYIGRLTEICFDEGWQMITGSDVNELRN
ncbi:MAG: hypothetical protein Tsb002_05170 [Wenzhouxiangellaceae bacterium]